MWIASLLLSLAAFGVSVYLTADHYAAADVLACSASGPVDCRRVTSSPESELSGIPVAVLGVGWSIAIIALSHGPPAVMHDGTSPSAEGAS